LAIPFTNCHTALLAGPRGLGFRHPQCLRTPRPVGGAFSLWARTWQSASSDEIHHRTIVTRSGPKRREQLHQHPGRPPMLGASARHRSLTQSLVGRWILSPDMSLFSSRRAFVNRSAMIAYHRLLPGLRDRSRSRLQPETLHDTGNHTGERTFHSRDGASPRACKKNCPRAPSAMRY
jgi:hypothetical protein